MSGNSTDPHKTTLSAFTPSDAEGSTGEQQSSGDSHSSSSGRYEDRDTVAVKPQVAASAIPPTAFTDYESFVAASTGEASTLPVPYKDGAVARVEWRTLGGQGGFGSGSLERDPQAICTTGDRFIGYPVALTGGGGGITPGPNVDYGILTDLELADDIRSRDDEDDKKRVRVTIDLVKPTDGSTNSGRIRQRSPVLGSWKLHVPATKRDLALAHRTVERVLDGTLETLDPQDYRTKHLRDDEVERLARTAPGDEIQTSAYATPLVVHSEQYSAIATKKGVSRTKTKSVTAVTVNNPRGGWFQLGWTDPSGASLPTVYLSGSNSHPPSPNTSFRIDEAMDSTDVECVGVTSIPEDELVEPDQDELQSPLPPGPRRRNLSDINGIGRKTVSTLMKSDVDITTTSVEHLAWSLHGDGPDDAELVRHAVNQTPFPKRVFDLLEETYTERIDD